MDPRPLLLVLALLTSAGFAQTPVPDKAALLGEIDVWRHAQLVHVDPPAPLTAEFEPKLDVIEGRVKASSDPADLVQLDKDFKAWQHDLLTKRYALNRRVGVERGSLNEFSKGQRQHIQAIAAEDDAVAQASLKQSSPELFDGGGSQEDGGVAGGPGGRRTNAGPGGESREPGLHIHDVAAPPPVTSRPLSWSAVWEYVDNTRGYKVAEAVLTRAKGFAGYCYASVKEGFIAAKDMLWAKIKSPTESGEIGIPPALAVDYQRAVNKNPALLAKLGYRRVDVSTIPGNDPSVIPSGTIFDFAPRCAGYSAEAGHIEIVGARSMLKDIPRSGRPSLDADEALACSDGCHGRTLNYFRTYAKKGCMSMYVPVKDKPTETASRVREIPAVPAVGT